MSVRKITPRMRVRYGLLRKPRVMFVVMTASAKEAKAFEERALDQGWSVVNEVKGKENHMTFHPPKDGTDGL